MNLQSPVTHGLVDFDISTLKSDKHLFQLILVTAFHKLCDITHMDRQTVFNTETKCTKSNHFVF